MAKLKQRKVVESKTYNSMDGGIICDSLECGHTVTVSLRTGHSDMRGCAACQMMMEGASFRYGDTIEEWDFYKDMPIRRNIHEADDT